MNIKPPYEIHPKTYQSAAKQYASFGNFKHPVGVTLTMKQAIYESGYRFKLDRMAADKNLVQFMNRLNSKVYGNAAKRFGMKIPSVSVFENDTLHRAHWHLLLDRPDRGVQSEHFDQLIRFCWSKTVWGARQIKVREAWDEGWLDYILKLRTKKSFTDSISWENWTAPTTQPSI